MLPRLLEARYVSGYTLWLRFSDGAAGEVDLSSALDGPIFEPLKNVEAFKTFQVHAELKTLVWPDGADLAPEYLRAALRVTA